MGGWLRAIIGSNPTVSHQLELGLELSVGLWSDWVLTKMKLLRQSCHDAICWQQKRQHRNVSVGGF